MFCVVSIILNITKYPSIFQELNILLHFFLPGRVSYPNPSLDGPNKDVCAQHQPPHTRRSITRHKLLSLVMFRVAVSGVGVRRTARVQYTCTVQQFTVPDYEL